MHEYGANVCLCVCKYTDVATLIYITLLSADWAANRRGKCGGEIRSGATRFLAGRFESFDKETFDKILLSMLIAFNEPDCVCETHIYNTPCVHRSVDVAAIGSYQ